MNPAVQAAGLSAECRCQRLRPRRALSGNRISVSAGAVAALFAVDQGRRHTLAANAAPTTMGRQLRKWANVTALIAPLMMRRVACTAAHVSRSAASPPPTRGRIAVISIARPAALDQARASVSRNPSPTGPSCTAGSAKWMARPRAAASASSKAPIAASATRSQSRVGRVGATRSPTDTESGTAVSRGAVGRSCRACAVARSYQD